jgi:dihydrofolate reductase
MRKIILMMSVSLDGFFEGPNRELDWHMVEFARIWRDMPKIVYSRTLERADWNTTVVRDVVPEEVMELKAEPGGDMVLGGADLAAAFMRHDLIDEYRLYVHPIVVGEGRPLFQPSDARITLRLAETRPFGNGVVLLRYQRPDARGDETRAAQAL